MSDTSGWAERLAEIVATAKAKQARKKAIRDELNRRRQAGLQIRHQTKLNRAAEERAETP